MHKYSYLEIVQTLLVLLCIAIPPWLTLRKYFVNRINKPVMIIMFLIYMVSIIFTQSQNILPFIVVLISIYLLYRTRNNEEEIYYLRPLKEKKIEVLFQSIAFKVIISIVNMWFAVFMMGFGIKLQQQEISKIFMDSSWTKIILLSLLTVVTAPILEEFIFRHTLYRQLSKKTGKIAACLITSGLFALLHFNFLGTISFFGVGIFNCYLYDKYGYRAAVINHFVFNFVSTFMIIMLKLFNVPI